MMDAARTSETLVNFYQTTRRYNPEDSRLLTHRRENLKSCLEATPFGSLVEMLLMLLPLLLLQLYLLNSAYELHLLAVTVQCIFPKRSPEK
jgi:hypothetical protein